jgi:hypothetical protein
MKMSRRKLVKITILTVAFVIIAYLAHDVYNLQKHYEQISEPLTIYGVYAPNWQAVVKEVYEIRVVMASRVAVFVLVAVASVGSLLVLNKPKCFRWINVVVLATTTSIMCLLLSDIRNLQEQYKLFYAPVLSDRKETPSYWVRLDAVLQEIQNMINIRVTELVLVTIVIAVILLVLHKRKVFKEKYAVTAALILLISFSQVPFVNALSPIASIRSYASVTMTVPQDYDLTSVTGYITPRIATSTSNLVAYWIGVELEGAVGEWSYQVQAGVSSTLGEELLFYIEWYGDSIELLGASFYETYYIQILTEKVGENIWLSAFIYDNDNEVILKKENLCYKADYKWCHAVAEATVENDEMEAEFTKLKYNSNYWQERSGFDYTITEEAPYYVHMYIHYYHFLATVGPGEAVEHGTTRPVPGYHTYDFGTSVTVWAEADNDYYFGHWGLDGKIYMQNPINITMDSSHRLEAYFSGSGPGGPPHPPRPLGNESIPIGP